MCERSWVVFECLKEPPDQLVVTYIALYDSLNSSISLLIVLRYFNLLDNLYYVEILVLASKMAVQRHLLLQASIRLLAVRALRFEQSGLLPLRGGQQWTTMRHCDRFGISVRQVLLINFVDDKNCCCRTYRSGNWFLTWRQSAHYMNLVSESFMCFLLISPYY